MPDQSADGLAEWGALSEALLRGVVHALNNRLTALSASAELERLGDDEFSAAAVLPRELGRLQRLNELLQLLAGDRRPPEALEVPPLVADAAALYQHHPQLLSTRIELVQASECQPVRAPRWALARLLLILLDQGRQLAEATGRDRVVLRIASDERVVTLQCGDSEPTAYVAGMAKRCGASDDDVGRGVVRLPSLLALRQREREARR